MLNVCFILLNFIFLIVRIVIELTDLKYKLTYDGIHRVLKLLFSFLSLSQRVLQYIIILN